MIQAETPIPPDLATLGSGNPDQVDYSPKLNPCLDPVSHEFENMVPSPGKSFNSATLPQLDAQENSLGSSEQQRQQTPPLIFPNFQLVSSITDTKTGDGVTTPNFFNGLDSNNINIFGGNNNNDATTGQPSFSDLIKLIGGNNYGETTDQPTPNSGTLPVDFSPIFRFKRRETYNYFRPGGL